MPRNLYDLLTTIIGMKELLRQQKPESFNGNSNVSELNNAYESLLKKCSASPEQLAEELIEYEMDRKTEFEELEKKYEGLKEKATKAENALRDSYKY